jgi:hypothetical protein
MSVLGLIMVTLAGMCGVAALSAAIYAALPRSFLQSADHGRFHGLKPAPLVPNGTPKAVMPEAAVLGGQAA